MIEALKEQDKRIQEQQKQIDELMQLVKVKVMALQSSGAISLDDIHVEAGGSTGSQATINDTDIRALISKSAGAQMAFNEWYGASAYTQTTTQG